MRLVMRFYIKEIRDFEDEGQSILDIFKTADIEGLVQLVSLGNNKCSEERAAEILDKYFEEGHSTIDAFNELKVALFGDKVDEEDNNTTNPKDYEFLSDIYRDYCMNLMSYGIQYSDFYKMDTKELYKVTNSIAQKMVFDTNSELAKSHTLSMMIGASVWGKLQPEPPTVSLKSKEDKQRLASKKSEMALRRFMSNHNVV